MKPAPEQLARLPKWAQSHIERLESDLESARREAATGWVDEPTEFCVARMDLDRGGYDRFLPLGLTDQARIGDIHFTIDSSGRPEVGSHDHTVGITSVCSNSIRLMEVER